ncbi:hypothetical protein FEM48_ZijujUnG0079500 [Ziziphus jujuba var. spinosa]|uniref:Uncharacterized protein n=1 Tax=Ziziphus jujuba var. spinosa TaxID=714518 RepID=A0A978U8P2_ZIZJJ|nr:hypothetical protein FEM48_ZijujUnG0079500 [Ziziphus jujuba var. spinosa]
MVKSFGVEMALAMLGKKSKDQPFQVQRERNEEETTQIWPDFQLSYLVKASVGDPIIHSVIRNCKVSPFGAASSSQLKP